MALLLAIGGFVAWQVFGPTVKKPADTKYFYVPTGSDYEAVKASLSDKGISSSFMFEPLAKKANYTGNVKPGRYEIKEGMSLYNLIRMLKSGNQSPVNFTINKFRTPQEIASRLAKNFEIDSLSAIAYLRSPDSLKKIGIDTNSLFSIIIPNTYSIKWNTTTPKVLERLKSEADKFWNEDRRAKAKQKNFSPEQIQIIASIVEEETNYNPEKGQVASVYMNRLRTGMKLQADPTVKFAMKDFGLKRILFAHLTYPSAYNTYYSAGLPPGPICTPSTTTIDAVLDAPETDYIFFVASPKFDGTHIFSRNYAEHQTNARIYQKALDSLIIARRNKEKI